MGRIITNSNISIMTRLQKEDYKYIVKNYEAMGRRAIAKKLGVSESHISALVREFKSRGIVITKSTEKINEAISELKDEGYGLG